MVYHSRKKLLVALLVMLVVSLLASAGCKKEEKDLPQVKYRDGWLPAPDNVATWATVGEGYFEKEGIKVDVTKGTGQEDATMMVAAGEYDMGMSSATVAIAGIAQGMPIKVVAVINQHNNLGMIVLESSGIKTPQDIEGKRVAIYPTGETFAMWKKFVEVNNLDPSTITELSMPYGFGPLLAGEVDVKPCGIGDPPRLEQPSIVFPFSDYAEIDRYMDCLIVNNKFAEEHPDRVRAFLKAYLQGMVFAAGDSAKAAEHLRRYAEGEEYASEHGIADACALLVELYVSEDTQAHGLGYSTPEKWQAVVDFLVAEGTLEKPVPVEDIFTNEYLPDPPIFP